MGYKDEFHTLIEAQRFEDARVLLEENKAFAYEDSFYFANMGWVLNHIGRHQEAIPYLQKGVQVYEEDAWMMNQLGYAYNHCDRFEEALACYLKGLAMGHDEPWIHGEIGWAYRQLKDDKKAIEYFENALLDDPNNVWILAQAGFTYRDMGDKANAEEYLRKVYTLAPDDDSIFDLVNFYKQEMRFEDEIEMLKKITNNDFEQWRNFELAYAYNRLKQYEDAIGCLKQCLAMGRDDTGVREELADAYMGLDQKEQADEQYGTAIKYYEKALEKNTDDAYWILQDMVWIAHKQDDMIRKLQYLDRMNKVKENEAWVLYHYAKSYANLGEFEKAITYCERCVKAEGETIETLSLKAWCMGKNKAYADALLLLQHIEEMGRKDCWLYNEMGWDHSELEDYQSAIDCYKRSLAIDDKDAWVTSQLAWNLSSLRQYDEALKQFMKAKDLGRNDGWIFANIGWCHAGMEQLEQAMEYYEQAKKLAYHESWLLTQYEETKKKLEGTNNEGKE